jgi:hypothetical protein
MSTLVLVFGAGILLVLLAVGALVWQIVHSVKSLSAAERLARALRWKPIPVPVSPKPVWFGGMVKGRWTVLRGFPKVHPRASVSSGISVSIEMRVLMELSVPAPLGVSVLSRSRVPKEAPFEEHFHGVGLERLGPSTREAMLGFVRQTLPTGVHGLSVRTSAQARDLKLADRAALRPEDLPPQIFPNARAVLAHDHPDATITPEKLRQILDEMAMVADEIERPFRY